MGEGDSRYYMRFDMYDTIIDHRVFVKTRDDIMWSIIRPIGGQMTPTSQDVNVT